MFAIIADTAAIDNGSRAMEHLSEAEIGTCRIPKSLAACYLAAGALAQLLQMNDGVSRVIYQLRFSNVMS